MNLPGAFYFQKFHELLKDWRNHTFIHPQKKYANTAVLSPTFLP